MISPHTPPGTKVRLCDEASHGRETRDGRVVVDHEVVGVAPDLGKVGMVRKIIVHSSAPSGFVAFVDGFVLPSDLAALNYVDLPECLTSCLTSQPLVREEELTGAAGVSCVPRRSLVAGAATISLSCSLSPLDRRDNLRGFGVVEPGNRLCHGGLHRHGDSLLGARRRPTCLDQQRLERADDKGGRIVTCSKDSVGRHAQEAGDLA